MRYPFIIALLLPLVSLTSCLRLDDLLFNANDTKIEEYTLDRYAGPVDFHLDSNYQISDSLIHLFQLYSQLPEETSSTKIYALYIGDISRIKTDTVIVYCHGNKDHMDFYWQRAKLLANAGGKNNFGVLMLDYRGYGLSEGKPTEAALYADVEAGLAWLMNKGLDNHRLVLYGFSLGSAPATRLSAYPQILTPAKLILEAPFASSTVMVQDASALAMPKGFFTNVDVNNAEVIKSVQQPFLWIHGDKDNFLSMHTHGKVVYDRYQGKYKEKYIVPEAGHEDAPLKAGFQKYLEVLIRFIRH